MSSVEQFLQINNQVDKEIRDQNKRYKKVNLVFIITDSVNSIAILGASIWGIYELVYLHKAYIYAFESILVAILTLILGLCALYLAISLHKSTGFKSNICLVSWHVVNTVVSNFMVVMGYFYRERYMQADEKDYYKY